MDSMLEAVRLVFAGKKKNEEKSGHKWYASKGKH